MCVRTWVVHVVKGETEVQTAILEEKMSTETVPNRYHPVHVALHWLMFLLVIMMLGVGKLVMPGVAVSDPQKPLMLQTHAYIGIFITILLVARLIVLFTTKRPAPADAGNSFLNFVARAVHFLLYFLLLGMAVSGLGLFQSANLPAIFRGAIPYPQDFFVYLPRIGHGLISTVLLLLILLHVGAAFYHQFFLKDNLLSRMWFGKR
jgi:cytochrome b561